MELTIRFYLVHQHFGDHCCSSWKVRDWKAFFSDDLIREFTWSKRKTNHLRCDIVLKNCRWFDSWRNSLNWVFNSWFPRFHCERESVRSSFNLPKRCRSCTASRWFCNLARVSQSKIRIVCDGLTRERLFPMIEENRFDQQVSNKTKLNSIYFLSKMNDRFDTCWFTKTFFFCLEKTKRRKNSCCRFLSKTRRFFNGKCFYHANREVNYRRVNLAERSTFLNKQFQFSFSTPFAWEHSLIVCFVLKRKAGWIHVLKIKFDETWEPRSIDKILAYLSRSIEAMFSDQTHREERRFVWWQINRMELKCHSILGRSYRMHQRKKRLTILWHMFFISSVKIFVGRCGCPCQ